MAVKQKVCKRCNLSLPLAAFHKDARRQDGRISFCRTCQAKRRQVLRYGLSETELDALLLKQGGHCAVCDATTDLVVDHDHSCCPAGTSCGKCVRGYLCQRHNLALGNLRDNVEELRLLITYLGG